MVTTPASRAGRNALIALLCTSAAGILIWSVVGGIEAFMMYVFNDTGTPVAQVNDRISLMMAPVILFAACAFAAGVGLARPTLVRILIAIGAFALTLAVLLLVPIMRAPFDFIIALVEQRG